MAKDVIFNNWKPNNPPCLLPNGQTQTYARLMYDEEVLVQDKDNPSEYIVGRINCCKADFHYSWIYRVQTEKDCEWRCPKDFKKANE